MRPRSDPKYQPLGILGGQAVALGRPEWSSSVGDPEELGLRWAAEVSENILLFSSVHDAERGSFRVLDFKCPDFLGRRLDDAEGCRGVARGHRARGLALVAHLRDRQLPGRLGRELRDLFL